MRKTNFTWAQSNDANVREPIRELADKGWQHRDIPKASNMNWIFKQISDEFTMLRKDMEQKAEELKSLLAVQSDEIQKQQGTIAHLKTEHNSLSESHDRLKCYTKRGLGKAFRDNDFNTGISRQICMLLREMEKLVQHYHPNFPTLPWPLNLKLEEDAAPTAGNESID
jgi:hypothetical protein